MTSLSTVGPATQRPVLACGGPLKMQGIMPSKGRSQIVFLYSVLKPPGEARRGEGKRTISVTKSWIPTCAVQRRWLRGRDLNPGPLGYEPSKSMTRLCLSMIYVEVDLRFSTLFWGILFSTCSSSCSRILAQRWPNDVGHQTREKCHTAQISLSFSRQISTIAADLIGMIGCPSGPTRICVGPDAGPLIRGSALEMRTAQCFLALATRSPSICVRGVCVRKPIGGSW